MMTQQDAVRLAEIRARTNYPGGDAAFLMRLIDEAYNGARATASVYVLDCPFCGIKPSVVSRPGRTKIECCSADCAGPIMVADSDYAAMLKWNRRLR